MIISYFSFYHIGGISFSGTAFDCWTQPENALEKTKKLSALMGCPTTTSRDMIRCLRYRPARAIVQATSEFMVSFVTIILKKETTRFFFNIVRRKF